MPVRELTPDEAKRLDRSEPQRSADRADAAPMVSVGNSPGVRELSADELGRVQPLQGQPDAGNVRELSPDEVDRIQPDHGAAYDVAMSAGGGFLRGVANVLGMPADLANQAAIALGVGDELGASDDPIGGSKSIQRGMNKIDAGLAPDQPYPSPPLGKVGEIIGGSMVPFAGMGLVARTGAEGGMLTKPLLEAFRSSPRTNALGELGAAAGAGVGGGVADAVDPDSEAAQIAGQLIGGFASPLSVTTRGIPLATRNIKRVADPYLPGGAQRQAARQLRGAVDNPQAAAIALEGAPDAVPGAQLTPAQETEDPALLRLERSLVRHSADFEGRSAELADRTNQALLKEAGDLAGDVPVERTRDHLEGRLQRLHGALNERGAQALAKARQRAQELTPAMRRRGDSSRIVREEIEGALGDAQAQENELWDQVPEDAATVTDHLKRTYAGLIEQQRKADDPGNIPSFVHGLLRDKGELGDVEPVEEIQALRSRLLHGIRDERAKDAPNRSKIANLERLQRAALDDLGANADDSEAGQKIKQALAFSRDLNERFRQGPVGKLLARDRRGGVTTPTEISLEGLLTKEGPEGGVNLKALNAAFRDTPERGQRYKDAAADFIRARFAQQATDDRGAVRPPAAKRFIRNNRDLLAHFPQLRAELEDTQGAQRAADVVANRVKLRQRGLADKRSSRAALFLNAPAGKEITRVLRAHKPAEAMRQLKRQVRQDPTGEALKGLKGQFVRDLLGRSQLHSFETQGQIRTSGEDMGRFFDQHKPAIDALFEPDEIGRLKRIIGTAKKLDRANASGRNLDELLNESPDALIDLVARIAGANIGARGASGAAGAPLVAAGAGSRFVRKLTNRVPIERTRDVLSQAMLDRDLMRTLLRKAESPKQQEALQRRLNAFLVNVLPQGDATENDDQGALRSAIP